MDDLPLHKVQISGPILASIIQRFITSPGDIEGLLFGQITHLTATTFSDDSPLTSSSTPPISPPDSPTLIATVTSFLSFNSSGDLSSASIRRLLSSDQLTNHSLLGWFSGRRKTPIRPSLRDSSLTASLSSDTQFSLQVENSPNSYNIPPCVFFLFTTPIQDQLIHTHEYRAYQFRLSTDSFEPKTIDVINLGPDFRGHYGSFSPNSSFPAIHCQLKASTSSYSSDDGKIDKESLMGMKKFSKDQKELDMVADGFQINRLNSLMGPEAANYTSELDNLYLKMMDKLDKLARLVEKSSAKVSEKENLNGKLRYKVAGME